MNGRCGMTRRTIAVVMSAAMLGLISLPSLAQTADAPAAAPAASSDAVPRKAAKAHAKKPAKAKTARQAPAPTAAPASIVGEDEASSLERRRKAFFAKPDDSGPDDPSRPVGVTLGNSGGGISPGVDFKF